MVTAKEKAEELIDKFLLTENYYKEACDYTQAKQCALIAVDEILVIQDYWGGVNSVYYRYWQEVKKELEAMK